MDESEINRIRLQFQSGQWPQFLEMVQIDGLRGWSGQSVVFNFPVVAVAGENGTGKSTILKAAASCYEQDDLTKTYYPSTFFVDTHWEKIEGVTLSYRVKRGADVLTHRIWKPTKRWRFPTTRPKRSVFFFDISRVLPMDAAVGYAKIAKLTAAEISTTSIEEDFRERLSHVLGRSYSNARFAVSDADESRPVGLLEREFGEVSQFHQGAGEDTTLDLFRALQEVPRYSLIVIDEVEASLHPRAQRRLTRFLLWLSRQKRLQIILSTHSPYVLEELPKEARVLLMPGPQGLNIVYGATPEFAMSRIDENIHPELVVFVEDREASIFLREILASDQDSSELLTRILIRPVGAADVVQLLGKLAKDNRLPHKAYAITDGDTPASDGVSLPGNDSPERVVFGDLKEKKWGDLPERFGIGAGTLFSAIEDAMLEPDHHRWTTLIGDRVRKSAQSVWEIVVSEWCRVCLNGADRQAIASAIQASMQ